VQVRLSVKLEQLESEEEGRTFFPFRNEADLTSELLDYVLADA